MPEITAFYGIGFRDLMDMPECMLLAYAEQLPRLQAEQLRHASLAAAFPHMTKRGGQDWMRSLTKAAQRVIADTSLFRWNGQPISVRGIRRRFAQAFGQGFSDE